ncbi:MAG: replication restart helicase PriA [Syntrophomonadaceae bacterium]|jgi:primosomal protein N' (replication factor Y)
MLGVDVLVDIPAQRLNHTFTYCIPEELKDKVAFGKRVLVELGARWVEGFVVGEKTPLQVGNYKSIKRILDEEPVFDRHLYQLALWISEYYLCPLSLSLNAMIPRALNKKKPYVIFPLIKQPDYEKQPIPEVTRNIQLFSHLWEKGELEWREALKLASRRELEELRNKGWLGVISTYVPQRGSPEGYFYVIKDFVASRDLGPLQKRAPRQAAAIMMVLSDQRVKQDILDKLFSRRCTKALVDKGFLTLEQHGQCNFQNPPVLTREQEKAVGLIKDAILSEQRREFLLFGVTGSGKTEIYLQAAQAAIGQGKGVIVLVPEIALTRHLVEVFSARISRMAVLHSSMPIGQRYEEWKKIQQGEVQLVLGTRSAIFAPLPRLGLIIIDEEQETSYKQEETPKYHAREVARQRARLESAVLVMGSATPSVETYYWAQKNVITLLELTQRVRGTIPAVHIEDMRIAFKKGNRSIISPLLREKISICLQKKEQTILFLNRRGYSPVTVCRECGNVISCSFCSVAMPFHQDNERYVCHYCGHTINNINRCPQCGGIHLHMVGFGTQKVEEEIKRLFPAARVQRLDLDSSQKTGKQKEVLQQMKERVIDILVGTQMVAKGFDFPEVSLVGIVDVDGMLNLPDFRAAERCFQLVVQAAGRAGRRNMPGEVVLQTYNPDNWVVEVAAQQDFTSFFSKEIEMRCLLDYPPFSSLLRFVVSSPKEKLAERISWWLKEEIVQITDAKEEDLLIMGPAPCPIYKLRNRFRIQLVVKCDNLLLLRSIGKYIIDKGVGKKEGIKLEIDINPLVTM